MYFISVFAIQRDIIITALSCEQPGEVSGNNCITSSYEASQQQHVGAGVGPPEVKLPGDLLCCSFAAWINMRVHQYWDMT